MKATTKILMKNKKGNGSYKRILYLSLFSISALVFLVIELFKIRFSTDEVTHNIIYGIVTRFLGSVICIIMMLYCSYGNLFSLKSKEGIKGILALIPCWIVVINNFPFISYLGGTAVINRSVGLVALYALQCFFVGLFEETAFRGCVFMLLLQGKHKTRKDIFYAIITSSAIFGAIHIVNLFAGAGLIPVIQQVGYSFLIGAMCSVALLVTQNIWMSVLLHAVFNFAGGVIPTLGSGEIWNLPTIIITAIIAVMVTVYMVILFVKYDVEKTEGLFEK